MPPRTAVQVQADKAEADRIAAAAAEQRVKDDAVALAELEAEETRALAPVVAPHNSVQYNGKTYGPGKEVPFTEKDAGERDRMVALGVMAVPSAALPFKGGDGPRSVLNVEGASSSATEGPQVVQQ